MAGPVMAAVVLEAVMTDGWALDAGQIHIEPRGDGLMVRARVRGVLRDRLLLAPSLARALSAHLEKLVSSGGVARLDVPSRDGDEPEMIPFAVSRLMTAKGPRFLLGRTVRPSLASPLTVLGLGPVARRVVHAALAERSGLILVAGQPGSGRRATVRAMLGALALDCRSVMAMAPFADGQADGLLELIPDEGHASRGYGPLIRDLVRQDPDVLALDLNDDRAAAEAAVEAAMGGKLVIARIDAVDSMAAISRLKALRVDSFLIASALRAVVAQRLAERLCPACRRSVQASPSTSALLGFDTGTIVYQAEGCATCAGTGFAGRVAVFEVVDADQTIRRLINGGGDAAILARHAFLNAPNLGSAARAMVREGVITPEEALRLSRAEPMIA